MKDTIDLTTDPVSAWYELTLLSPTTIGLRVHKLALRELQQCNWPSITQRFSKPFTAPIDGDCGLNKAFISAKSDHADWIMWQFSLPQVDTEVERAFEIRTTFNLFVGYLSMCNGFDTDWPHQLMFVENFCSSEHSSFKAVFSPATIAWLAIPENTKALSSISQAMDEAFTYIWRGQYDGGGFRATCEDNRYLHLLPGDRAGLDPVPNSSRNPRHGYELICHNINTWMVQLSLLVGLAKLHDLIRASSNGQ